MKVFETFLQVSAIGAGLIGALLILSRVMGRSLASRYKRWAWLFIALRLMIPLNISLPQAPVTVAVPNLRQPVVRMQATQPVPKQETPLVGQAEPGIANNTAHTSMTQPQGNAPAPVLSPAPSVSQIAFWVWMVGVAVSALYEVVGYAYTRRKLLRWSRPASPETQQRFSLVCDEMNTGHNLPLRQSAEVRGPMIIGLFRPILLLPDQVYDAEDLHLIFRHELTHYQHRDTGYKALLLVARILHWFNPLVYAMYRRADIDMEFACDEAVLRAVGLGQSRRYGETILSAACAGSGCMTALSTHFQTGKKNLANRIRNIMHTQKRRFGAIIVTACMGVSLLGGMMIGFATEEADAGTFSPDAAVTSLYGKLWDLRPDGYRDMTISEFRDAVFQKMNEDEMTYLALYDLYDEGIHQMRYTDDGASFLYNTLFALTAEKWETARFPNHVVIPGTDIPPVEYEITSQVLDPEAVTVGEFEAATVGIMDDVEALVLANQQDGIVDEEAVGKGIKALAEAHSTNALEVSFLKVFIVPADIHIATQIDEAIHTEDDPNESIELDISPATQADYDLVLALKTPDYEQMTVQAFKERVQDAFRDEKTPISEAYQRILSDVARGSYPETLSSDDLNFLQIFLESTIRDYVSEYKTQRTGEAGYPYYQGYYFGRLGMASSASIQYDFEYEFLKPAEMTTGERDARLMQVIGGMEDYLYESEENGWTGGKIEMDATLEDLCLEASDALMDFRPLKTYYSVDAQGVRERQVEAYRLIEALSTIDTTLPMETYKKEVEHMAAEAGTNIFQAMSEATRAYDVDDPLYPFYAGSLMTTSSEMFAEQMGGNEHAYKTGYMLQERYMDREAYIDSIRDSFEDEEDLAAFLAVSEKEGLPLMEYFAGISYVLFYDVTTPDVFTVQQRDERLAAVIDDMQAFMDSLSKETLASGQLKSLAQEELNRIASAHSDGEMQLTGELQNMERFGFDGVPEFEEL